ncbi:GNAT family N-acetyltransferase [Streptomyces sp. P17]|uniref:GNAT family N-acetyltransferase n=1 Tax=Streptomyces sp. P17 TaxID=3074716 RepID=UPI0028F44076|nr:GNAT family N-acetyltransferase [Streptomyces sp. P17]MDT9701141.1 GNAT family N-acetyltransferase [Streptomyces sp. P17]
MIPPTWRYVWNNSADPRVVRAHTLADAALAARPRVTLSRPDGAGPVLAYGGLSQGLTHVLPFLEQRRGTASQRTRRGTTWADLMHGRVAPGADILAVGMLRDRVPARLPRHSLLLPFRVTLAVPVGPDPQDVLGRLSRKARQQHARELRSHHRTLEVAAGGDDFAFFYDGMHRPTMVNRHGDAARSEDRDSALVCLFRRGVLFFLCESGRRVAGMLCRLEGRTLVVRLAGVARGDDEAYASGTYLAMYVLILQWAAEHGLTRVDLSGCEPFLSKGIFQFKRKMHPEVALPGNHFTGKRLMLRVRRDSPSVRDFLAANPVLAFGQEQGFEAVYFHDEDRPPRLDLRWNCPGVRGQRLVHFDDFLAGLPDTARQPPAVHPNLP